MHPPSVTDVHLFAARTDLNSDTTTTDTECLFVAWFPPPPFATSSATSMAPSVPTRSRVLHTVTTNMGARMTPHLESATSSSSITSPKHGLRATRLRRIEQVASGPV